PDNGTDRVTATHRLGKYRQIRRYTKVTLGTSKPHPETGNDLIKNKGYSIFIAYMAQRFQEARFRHHTAVIAHHRLANNRSYLRLVRADDLPEQFRIIPGQDQELLAAVGCQSRRPGKHCRLVPASQRVRTRGADAIRHVIQPTVIMPFEAQ